MWCRRRAAGEPARADINHGAGGDLGGVGVTHRHELAWRRLELGAMEAPHPQRLLAAAARREPQRAVQACNRVRQAGARTAASVALLKPTSPRR